MSLSSVKPLIGFFSGHMSLLMPTYSVNETLQGKPWG